MINDIFFRPLRRANIVAVKEPTGLLAGSNLRPDGATLIPWSSGKCLTSAQRLQTLSLPLTYRQPATRWGGSDTRVGSKESKVYYFDSNIYLRGYFCRYIGATERRGIIFCKGSRKADLTSHRWPQRNLLSVAEVFCSSATGQCCFICWLAVNKRISRSVGRFLHEKPWKYSIISYFLDNNILTFTLIL